MNIHPAVVGLLLIAAFACGFLAQLWFVKHFWRKGVCLICGAVRLAKPVDQASKGLRRVP